MGVFDVVEPLDPEAFSQWWLVAGIALALAGVALLVGPWLATRLRRRRRARPAGGDVAEPPSRSAVALEEIDRIEAAWEADALTDRAAAQGIVAAVKRFAGGEAATLTLLDLRLRGDLPNLVAVIEAAYPVEFGVVGEGDVLDLARRARDAVGIVRPALAPQTPVVNLDELP